MTLINLDRCAIEYQLRGDNIDDLRLVAEVSKPSFRVRWGLISRTPGEQVNRKYS